MMNWQLGALGLFTLVPQTAALLLVSIVRSRVLSSSSVSAQLRSGVAIP